MSENERKAVRALLILDGFIENGHFKIYSGEVKAHVDKLYMEYCNVSTTGKDLERIKFDVIESDCKIGTSGFDSNYKMLFAMLVEITEPFARFTKGARGQLWRDFYEYAKNNDFHKSLRKKAMFKEEIESLDQGILIAETIFNPESGGITSVQL